MKIAELLDWSYPMRMFFYGFVLGMVVTMASCHPAPAHAADAATEDEWIAAQPIEADPEHAAPPRGSFGFKGCGVYAIWVFLSNGKSYRIDSTHQPKNVKDMQKLLDWLNTGPTDIQEYPCGASI